MISSAEEYFGVKNQVRDAAKRCIDIHLGKIQPSSWDAENLESARVSIQEMRMDQMEYALMRRNFAADKLTEAKQYKWEFAIRIRAAVLLELE